MQVKGQDGLLASDAVDSDAQVRFYLAVPTDRKGDFTLTIKAGDYKPGELRVTLAAGQVTDREVLLAPASPTIGDRTSSMLGGITPWLKYLIPGTIAVIALAILLPRLRRRFA